MIPGPVGSLIVITVHADIYYRYYKCILVTKILYMWVYLCTHSLKYSICINDKRCLFSSPRLRCLDLTKQLLSEPMGRQTFVHL